MTTELSVKLHPDRFSNMSGKMAGILGFVLGESWSKPKIAELHVTADGFLLARDSHDVGCNSFIGSISDWDANLSRLFSVAEVTPEEEKDFSDMWSAKVKDWRMV